MSDWLWTICFMATGFTLVVQHYRIQHLEIWRDNHLKKTHGLGERRHD